MKIKNILKENTEKILSIPYMGSTLKFKCKIISKVGSDKLKVQYQTGGEWITSDVPLEWVN